MFKSLRDWYFKRRMIRKFIRFRSKYPEWGGPDIEEAFIFFCKLENTGPAKVRQMLEKGYFG